MVDLFAREGARQVLVARREPLPGTGLKAAATSRSERFIAGDVCDPATASRAVAAALSSFGRLDILVNSAGFDARVGVADCDIETYRGVFDVNVLGSLLMLQAAAGAMADRGGCIVNVSSLSALNGVAGKGVYGAAKSAVIALTRTAALELAPKIRVNAVAPGPTDTPLLRSYLKNASDPDLALAEAVARSPQGRLATGQDVAHAILFLASDQSSHVTGVTLPVDGGLTILTWVSLSRVFRRWAVGPRTTWPLADSQVATA